jgi:hypothetical protein
MASTPNWFRIMVETGRECGLETTNEAHDNMLLHFPFAPGELEQYNAAINGACNELDWAERLEEYHFED